MAANGLLCSPSKNTGVCSVAIGRFWAWEISPRQILRRWRRCVRQTLRKSSTAKRRLDYVPFPAPVPGLVIRYSYLWRHEHVRGQDEGVKDRPCAIVLTTIREDGVQWVTVLPITQMPPADSAMAIELPMATKRRLRLDSERSWVVLTEANRFIWPGPDLRPAVAGDATSVAYGQLPYALFEEVRRWFIAALREHAARMVPRTQ